MMDLYLYEVRRALEDSNYPGLASASGSNYSISYAAQVAGYTLPSADNRAFTNFIGYVAGGAVRAERLRVEKLNGKPEWGEYADLRVKADE